MVEPDDFGFSPLATLARLADVSRSSRHGVFWKVWMAAVFAGEPHLKARIEPDRSDPTATHEFESARGVRIGCALQLPRGKPAGGLIVLHGYENVPPLEEAASRWKSLIERGLVVLCLRVRGYRGSQADVPMLVKHAGNEGGGEWITYGLEVPLSEAGFGCEWSYSYAVADVVNACRALRNLLDRQSPDCPVFMQGESFGAGLGLVAAAQLQDRQPTAAPVRMAMGVPSMGDWNWRLAHKPNGGMGGIIGRYMNEHAWLESQVIETLRMFDTAIHARRIRWPVLCKLALLDDVVPAPTAAAVFNALGSDPGMKQRFVTRYGHFDGGIADLRRHVAFDRQVERFLDPAIDPAVALANVDATAPAL